jgi:hypothetical protein
MRKGGAGAIYWCKGCKSGGKREQHSYAELTFSQSPAYSEIRAGGPCVKSSGPVESPSAVRHVAEPFGLSSSALSSLPKGSGRKLMSSRSEPNGRQVERVNLWIFRVNIKSLIRHRELGGRVIKMVFLGLSCGFGQWSGLYFPQTSMLKDLFNNSLVINKG